MGDIIEGWQKVALAEIAEIYDGPHATPEKIEAGPIYLNISNLVDGRVILDNTYHLSEEDYVLWTRRITPLPRDIVFSYETRIGQAAIIPDGLRCCLGRRMGLLRVNQEKALPEYLVYAYLGPEFQDVIRENKVTGGTVERILLTKMPRYEIHLPPLTEQRKIAAILGTWDAAIATVEQLIAALQARKQGLMQRLLTGAVRFPEFAGSEWQRVRIGDLGKVITGNTPSTFNPEFYGSGYPFVSPADLGINKYIFRTEKTLTEEGLKETRRLEANSILFSCIGIIGKTGIAGCTLATNQQINAVTCSSKYDPEYIYYALTYAAPRIAKMAAQNVVPILNKTNFESETIDVPVSVQEQHAISNILKTNDESLTVLSRHVVQLQSQKQALMQQLLTGQVRVNGQEEAQHVAA